MALGVNVTGIGVPTGIYLLALSKSQQIMSSEWDSVPLNLKSSAAYLDHIKETKRDNSTYVLQIVFIGFAQIPQVALETSGGCVIPFVVKANCYRLLYYIYFINCYISYCAGQSRSLFFPRLMRL